jgi:uncharacterized membrane protein
MKHKVNLEAYFICMRLCFKSFYFAKTRESKKRKAAKPFVKVRALLLCSLSALLAGEERLQILFLFVMLALLMLQRLSADYRRFPVCLMRVRVCVCVYFVVDCDCSVR